MHRCHGPAEIRFVQRSLALAIEHGKQFDRKSEGTLGTVAQKLNIQFSLPTLPLPLLLPQMHRWHGPAEIRFYGLGFL